MDLASKLRYLNSADGPNIPMRTLGIYCGTDASVICRFINGTVIPSEKLQRQIEKGIEDLSKEIWKEVHA